MNLWLVQWLCPTRHALAAVPYDPCRVHTSAEAEALLLTEATRFGLLPICGLCGSTDLHFEHGKLPYSDWDAARAALFDTERKNIETRIAIDHLKQGTLSARQRYSIQVVYPSGDVAYLRHGADVGAGAIVQFRDRKTADINVDFIRPGLDEGTVVTVVQFPTGRSDA
jgi:hypothetical protein